MSFTCPQCYRVSYNPNDEREGYCGNCHAFTGRPEDGQLRPRSSGIETEQNGAMQLPQEHKEPETEQQVCEVQRDRKGDSMFGMRGERMEQDPKQTVSKVSGDRSFVETYRNQLTGQIVWAISGTIMGMSAEQLIFSRYPASYIKITTITIITLLLVQFAWMTVQFMHLRRWSKDLRAERQGFINYFNDQVDKLLADDPAEAARVKMAMELRWPKP